MKIILTFICIIINTRLISSSAVNWRRNLDDIFRLKTTEECLYVGDGSEVDLFNYQDLLIDNRLIGVNQVNVSFAFPIIDGVASCIVADYVNDKSPSACVGMTQNIVNSGLNLKIDWEHLRFGRMIENFWKDSKWNYYIVKGGDLKKKCDMLYAWGIFDIEDLVKNFEVIHNPKGFSILHMKIRVAYVIPSKFKAQGIYYDSYTTMGADINIQYNFTDDPSHHKIMLFTPSGHISDTGKSVRIGRFSVPPGHNVTDFYTRYKTTLDPLEHEIVEIVCNVENTYCEIIYLSKDDVAEYITKGEVTTKLTINNEKSQQGAMVVDGFITKKSIFHNAVSIKEKIYVGEVTQLICNEFMDYPHSMPILIAYYGQAERKYFNFGTCYLPRLFRRNDTGILNEIPHGNDYFTIDNITASIPTTHYDTRCMDSKKYLMQAYRIRKGKKFPNHPNEDLVIQILNHVVVKDQFKMSTINVPNGLSDIHILSTYDDQVLMMQTSISQKRDYTGYYILGIIGIISIAAILFTVFVVIGIIVGIKCCVKIAYKNSGYEEIVKEGNIF